MMVFRSLVEVVVLVSTCGGEISVVIRQEDLWNLSIQLLLYCSIGVKPSDSADVAGDGNLDDGNEYEVLFPLIVFPVTSLDFSFFVKATS